MTTRNRLHRPTLDIPYKHTLSGFIMALRLIRSTAARSAGIFRAAGMRKPSVLAGARFLSFAKTGPLGDTHEDFQPQRKEMNADSKDEVNAFLEDIINQSAEKKRPLLFMKGTPEAPNCGFSYQVVRILHAEGVEFDSVNVLEDSTIREGIKSYSDWPTIPQLYVNNEFVGGCDILTSMHQDGELTTLFEENEIVVD